MSNHYVYMASDKKSLELGERPTAIKPDGIRIENMSEVQGETTNPFLKRVRIRYGKYLSWDKILIILIFIIVFALLILLIIFFTVSYNFNIQLLQSRKADEPCLTFECLQAAVDINKSLKTSVSPCVDFHQYACGQWEDKQIFPKGKSRFGTFDVVNIELFKIQKKLLENQQISDQTSAWAKTIRLYDSCNNLDQINVLRERPLLEQIVKVFSKYGGWDMQSPGSGFPIGTWDLNRVVEDPNVLSPIFKLQVFNDEKDSRKNIIYVQLAYLMLEKQYIQNLTIPENRKISNAFIKYMKRIGEILSLEKTKFPLLNDIMELESQIAAYHPKEEEQRDPEQQYNKMSITKLQTEICPLFNWTNILRNRFSLVNITIPQDIKVIVTSPNNLKNICALFETYKSTNSKKLILHNYIIWQFVFKMVGYLSQDFTEAFDEFNKVYRGSIGSEERWKTCVSTIQSTMGYVLGNMYITQEFDKKSKIQVLEMVNLIKDKFRENLLSNKWMDAVTLSEAIKKIDSMNPIIGYTDASLNKPFIEKYYQGVNINNDTFYENICRLMEMDALKMYGRLNIPAENSTMETPQEVNAFYSPNRNEILFPAGILQIPFFNPEFPRSLKYGAIGSVIGHEVTHGFDDAGSKYDASGNLRSWWTNETRTLFKEKADCIVKQYSQYSLYGKNVNGLNTLGENIADNGGLRLTYRVFKDLEKKYGTENPLPGLKFTNEQLFFISHARIWCGIQTRQNTLLNIFSNTHTPANYRIIGTLSNMKEFADAFNCPINSPMNPEKKCIVW